MQKKKLIQSVIVLTVICLAVSALLALTNQITAPMIEENNAKAEQQSLQLALPDGTDFQKLEVVGAPQSVTAAYRDAGGAGYVFVLSLVGYSGSTPMRASIGVSPDGKIVNCYVISCDGETAGYGKQIVTLPWFLEQYVGRTSADVGDTALISGATITSGAFRAGVADAMAAYEILAKEDGGR